MKALAINGSPRPKGNTAAMLKAVLGVCAAEGLETEFYQAGGRAVMGCHACGLCEANIGRCVTDDWVNELYLKVKAADAIIIGSPTYFADLTPETKALIDRIGFMSRRDGMSLSRKIGAAVSAVRRAGGIHTLDSIIHFFTINDMIVPGSSYWGVGQAKAVGDFDKDAEGIATMKRLGENIAWLAKALAKS